MNKHFTKENTQIEDKHVKRCSRSLPVRKMRTKTTLRCHHSTPIRMAKINTVTTPTAVRTQRSQILVHGWWDVCGTTVRNSVVVSYQTNMQLVQGPASVLVGVYPRETQTSHNVRCTRVFVEDLPLIAPNCRQPRS